MAKKKEVFEELVSEELDEVTPDLAETVTEESVEEVAVSDPGNRTRGFRA